MHRILQTSRGEGVFINMSLFATSVNGHRGIIHRFGALTACSVMLFSGINACSAQDSSAADALAAPMAVTWKYTEVATPSNPAGPVYADNTVYYCTGKKVYALDARSGSKKWSYPAGSQMSQDTLATPTVADGTLFVPTGDGLYALNASTGELKYPAFKLINGGVVSSPAVVGANVYFAGANGKIYGINADSGQPLSGAWGQGFNTQVGLMGNLSEYKGDLYYITSNNVLHCVDTATATELWQHRLEGSGDTATPVLKNGLIYITEGQVLACYHDTGQINWQMVTHNTLTCDPGVDNQGDVYIATSAPAVYCIGPDRTVMWKKPALVDFQINAAPVVTNNLVVVGSSAGGIYAFNKATGDLEWDFSIAPTSVDFTKVPTFNQVVVSPVAANGQLFVVTDDGSLTTFSHNAQDTIPPTITPLEPLAGEYCNGQPPFTFKAKISDQGSGLDPASITLTIDGKSVPHASDALAATKISGFTFKKDTGILEFILQETSTGVSTALPDGHHTVVITAKDWFGNVNTRSWVFTTGDAYPSESDAAALAQGNRGSRFGNFGGPGMGGGFGRGGFKGAGGGGGD